MANFWENAWDSIWGGVKDFASDPNTYQTLLAELMRSDPKVSTKKMKEILQLQQPFNYANISTPLGQTQTTFDPETGQPTTIRSIPQSSLNFLNSKMQQLAEGGWNDYDAPAGFREYGEDLINQRRGWADKEPISANFWEVPEADTFDFVPYQNFWEGSSTLPPTGGGPTTPGGAYDPVTSPGGSELIRSNEEWVRDLMMSRPDLFGYDPNDDSIDYMQTPLNEQAQALLDRMPSGFGEFLAENMDEILGGLGGATGVPGGGSVGDWLGDKFASWYCSSHACSEADKFSLYRDMADFINEYGGLLDGLGDRDMSEDLGANPDEPQHPYQDDPDNRTPISGGGGGGGGYSGGYGNALRDLIRMYGIPVTGPGGGGVPVTGVEPMPGHK